MCQNRDSRVPRVFFRLVKEEIPAGFSSGDLRSGSWPATGPSCGLCISSCPKRRSSPPCCSLPGAQAERFPPQVGSLELASDWSLEKVESDPSRTAWPFGSRMATSFRVNKPQCGLLAHMVSCPRPRHPSASPKQRAGVASYVSILAFCDVYSRWYYERGGDMMKDGLRTWQLATESSAG